MKRKSVRTLKLFFVLSLIIFSQLLPLGLDYYSSMSIKNEIKAKCLKKNFKTSLICIDQEFKKELSEANSKIGTVFYLLSMYQFIENFKSMYLKKIGMTEDEGYRYIAMADLAFSSIRASYSKLSSRIKNPLYAPFFSLIDDRVYESSWFTSIIRTELDDIEKEVKANLPLKIHDYREDEDIVFFLSNT